MTKTIFLSHIHEERQLALVVKKYVEDEFSGFVDVFVSSDGVTITNRSKFPSPHREWPYKLRWCDIPD